MRVSVVLITASLLTLVPARLHAAPGAPQEPASLAKPRRNVWTPYCGLYCLYAAIRHQGRQIEFSSLLKSEYCAGRQGSSLAELAKAAEDLGIHTAVLRNLTGRELRRSPYPVILHVKPSVELDDYTHYELFLPTNSPLARLYDPPDPPESVPFSRLAPRWDGVGIVVSAAPVDIRPILGGARVAFAAYLAVTLTVILALHYVKRLLPQAVFRPLRNRIALSIAQAALFAIAALLFGFLYHFTNDAGLLANHTATAAIQRAHLPNFIPKITEKKLRRLLAAGALLIDARLKSDFERGHIQNAISVPVNASDDERAKAAAHIPKDARIVVYCQSAACRYADKIAVRLTDDGFSNIYIYRPGWNDWITKHPTQVSSSDTAATQKPSPNTPAQDSSAATDPSQDAS